MFIQICRPTEKLPTGAVYSAAVGNLHFGFLRRIHVVHLLRRVGEFLARRYSIWHLYSDESPLFGKFT
jgi:hypothetical protein